MKHQRVEFSNQTIYEACRDDKPLVLINAVKNGFDVNTFLRDCSTALHIAIFFHHTKCVNTLIKLGADVNILSDDGRIPLVDAIVNGTRNIVNILIAAGAHADCPANDVLTPDFRVLNEAHPSFILKLMELGARMEIYNNELCYDYNGSLKNNSETWQNRLFISRISCYKSAVTATLVFKKLGFPRFLAGLMGEFIWNTYFDTYSWVNGTLMEDSF